MKINVKRNISIKKILFFIFFLTIFNSNNTFAKSKTFPVNLQKIYNNQSNYFFENLFFKQIPNCFLERKDFVFSNSKGEIFKYQFKNDNIEKIFNLQDFFLKENKKCNSKNKYRFDEIKIFNRNSEEFFIFTKNSIFSFSLKEENSENLDKKFDLKWVFNSSYEINLNTVIFEKNQIIFSKSNEIIESLNINNGSVNWFIENSILRSIRTNNHPVLFIKNKILYAFFSNGRILKINPENGEVIKNQIIFEDFLEKKDCILNKDINSYYINDFFNKNDDKSNFIGNNLIVLTDLGQIIIDIEKNQNIFQFDKKLRFQKIFYTKDYIYAFYQNKFFIKIDKDFNVKYFNISKKDNFCKLNLYKKLLISFQGRNNDYFFFDPKIFIFEENNKKFFMFVGGKNILYFDLTTEKFSNYLEKII